ncbi:ArsR/SmtB family transcription factor [Hoeflea prorocentri]|uniref:Metalloregulator ArsR/SmtB family transcription factor n=1 Tax=Hoeflea prorocentri TaxID=1922333 RepID=A0A9X3ZJV3_9HYPH|nr:metalloregulator ArsR/SmtB family transcription factor [Hoeflea prorocentri]MCY6383488.1 metalloregulator ArsR/SmtB family transcription factor [Hoeflea prorocentri]MDA5401288.1 metalloregulator ArsR/SmtB family transcription factor [Hoeflea prorocentri]
MHSLDTIFHALSDPTRRAILARLAEGEATVDQIREPFSMSQPSISRHLKVLERAGLISTRVDGTSRPRRIEPAALTPIEDWLDRYRMIWQENYTRLDDVLNDLKQEDDTP